MTFPRPLRLFVLAGGLCLGVAAPSLTACVEPNPDHCVHNGGDSFCAAKADGATPYCSDGTCVDAPADGCVATPPIGCWSCAGVDGDNSACDGAAEGDGDGDTTGDGDGDATGDGDVTGDGDTTGDGDPPECVDNRGCQDPTPLCEAGTCVSCVEARSSDCSELVDTPICDQDSGLCVVCSSADDSACTATTPICVANECVACTQHEQCPDSACNLATGACMAADRVWWVDQGVPVSGDGTLQGPFKSIAEALTQVANGEEGTIHVVTAGTHDEAVTVAGGRTIALLGEPGATTISADGLPCVTLASGASLFAAGLRLTNGTAGIQCTGAELWFDRGRVTGNMGQGAGQGASLSACAAHFRRAAIVNNAGGGISFVNGGTLALENSTVGGSNTDVVALAAGGGPVSIVYSTLAASSFASTITCASGGAELTIRNSLLVNRDMGLPVLSGCDDATVTASATEALLGDNLVLGEMNTAWFDDWASGELTLSAMAPAQLGAAAVWLFGDPATDIDGTARPSQDGASDYAGADVP